MNISPLRAAGAAAIALALLAGSACSNDDSSSDTTEATTTTTTADGDDRYEAIIFDKMIQGQLATVGCFTGADDGIIGPLTDAAIVAYQTARGLEADGELGPKTDAALSEDAAANKIVCVAAPTPTTAPTTSTVPPANFAPCTGTALVKELPDPEAKVVKYGCVEENGRWAGVKYVDADTGGAILKAASGVWVIQDTEALCAAASPEVPEEIKEIGCITKP
ncbi:MAG: peptidoglycan-binding protein [Acidimicrobiia bacterium]|nr:peptidoglycan-binding protein [Acidimicrobiia bacterium]